MIHPNKHFLFFTLHSEIDFLSHVQVSNSTGETAVRTRASLESLNDRVAKQVARKHLYGCRLCGDALGQAHSAGCCLGWLQPSWRHLHAHHVIHYEGHVSFNVGRRRNSIEQSIDRALASSEQQWNLSAYKGWHRIAGGPQQHARDTLESLKTDRQTQRWQQPSKNVWQ